jgi:hypothetical protein
VHGAGVAVHEFAAEQRKLDWASEGQAEVDEFLDAVNTDAERSGSIRERASDRI